MERIYHFRLPLDEHTLRLFPQARGKRGAPLRKALGEQIRAAFAALGGVIQALEVDKGEIVMTWQEDNRQPGLQTRLAALLGGASPADGLLLLELFLSDEPENAGWLYALGTAYSDRNDLERALELFTRLVACAPQHVNGRVAKGSALLKAGRIEEGLRELEAAVRLAPENLWAHRSLGAGLMLLNRYSEAVANLRLAREIDPQDQPAWFEYGQALEAMGESEQAEMAYGKTIEIDEFSALAEQARQRRAGLEEKKKI